MPERDSTETPDRIAEKEQKPVAPPEWTGIAGAMSSDEMADYADVEKKETE